METEVDIKQSYVDAFAVRIQNWDMLALRLQPNEFVRYTVLRNNLVHKIKTNYVGTQKEGTSTHITTLIEDSYETLQSFWQNVELSNNVK